MKMSQKLILLFSILAVLTTVANSIFSYKSKMVDLETSTSQNLSALCEKMLSEVEQQVLLMDYAIESLTANISFMDSFYAAGMEHDSGDIGETVAIQNIISRTLYQEPILENFHRVSVYARNGFFLSNRFEKTDTVASMSDEAQEIISNLPYLPEVDALPFQRHIVGPHGDPWVSVKATQVFTVVRSVTWHGQLIGYIEVNASVSDLADILLLENIEGFLAQAILDDGRDLFRCANDDVEYKNLNLGGMTRVPLKDGGERLVVRMHSDYLGMSVYVSQDMSVYNRQAEALLRNYVLVAAVILLITILLIALISLGLTSSIRKLTRKVKQLPPDSLLKHPNDALTDMVSARFDREIYQLEQVFNELLNQLRLSMKNEIVMREGTLQAQFSALQMQINPHFIYNTLNIISAKSMECGNEEIIEICDQFAQMLRYATDLRSKTATLGEELRNARRYLMLAKARYEELLAFDIDMPQDAEGFLVPKLTLQPIVENALTHGFSGRSDRREIKLTGTLKNDLLTLTIRDNGNGFDEEVLENLRKAFARIEREHIPESETTGEHLGLINTYLRLFYYSKGMIRMRIFNDHGAVIMLTLPRNKEDNDV